MPLLGDNVEQLVNEINDSFESEPTGLNQG